MCWYLVVSVVPETPQARHYIQSPSRTNSRLPAAEMAAANRDLQAVWLRCLRDGRWHRPYSEQQRPHARSARPRWAAHHVRVCSSAAATSAAMSSAWNRSSSHQLQRRTWLSATPAALPPNIRHIYLLLSSVIFCVPMCLYYYHINRLEFTTVKNT